MGKKCRLSAAKEPIATHIILEALSAMFEKRKPRFPGK